MLEAYFQKKLTEAGCDEAGRGCLAGPVVASAVILPKKIKIMGLNDSKKLSEIERERLAPIIREKALFWAIGICSPQEIDQINILNASILAMHRALNQLPSRIDYIIVDGNRFKPYKNIPYSCIVKGDGKYLSIAAASVLAKTYRDKLMTDLHTEFPNYSWNNNKGYPTIIHRKAIAEFGPSVHHRLSFQLLPRQLELFRE
jgi:ribonuclease HII